MQRRELLKVMAVSAPALTMAGSSLMRQQLSGNGADAVPASVQTLNVIFEGPMIFLMQNPQVRVLVPRVEGHSYLIEGQTVAASSFTLKGASGPGDVSKTQYDLPPGADAFWLSASQLQLGLALGKDPYFSFVLPAPNRVVALSAREADIVDAFGNRRIAVMPTSYAFVYDVESGGNLRLDPNPGWVPRDRVVQERFTNLVVAAGLPRNMVDPTGQHAHVAFSEITSYLPGLKMQFFNSGTETQAGSVDGLPAELPHGHGVAGRHATTPRVTSAVFDPSRERPRLVLAAAVVDCKGGGLGVTIP